MQKTLLTVPHLHQLSDGDCLAACAAMVLAYYEVSIDYPDLLQILKIKSFGAPARNIKHLESLGGLKVSYRSTDITGLKEMLLDGKPVIVFIRTSELPYWNYETDHAIVIVGFNEDNIFANDPHFDHSPIEIPRGDFELAWLERDYYYGFVERIISE